MENDQGNNSSDKHVESRGPGEPTHNWISVSADNGADNEYVIYSQPIREPLPRQPTTNYSEGLPERAPGLAGTPTPISEVIRPAVEHDPGRDHDAETSRLSSADELSKHIKNLCISTSEPYTGQGRTKSETPGFSSPSPGINIRTNVTIKQTVYTNPPMPPDTPSSSPPPEADAHGHSNTASQAGHGDIYRFPYYYSFNCLDKTSDPAGINRSSTMHFPPSISFTLHPEDLLRRGEGTEKQPQGHSNITDSNPAPTSDDRHHDDASYEDEDDGVVIKIEKCDDEEIEINFGGYPRGAEIKVEPVYSEYDDEDIRNVQFRLNWAQLCLPPPSLFSFKRYTRRHSPYRSSPLRQVTFSWEQQQQTGPRGSEGGGGLEKRTRTGGSEPGSGSGPAVGEGPEAPRSRRPSPELGHESGSGSESEENREGTTTPTTIPITATIPDTDDEDEDEDEDEDKDKENKENEGGGGSAADVPATRAGGSDRIPLRARAEAIEDEVKGHASTDAEN